MKSKITFLLQIALIISVFTQLEVYAQCENPELYASEAIKCDDNIADGITSFNRNSFIRPYPYEATFHRTQNDANNGANPLPETFYNITPYRDKFYVRLEDSGGCYSTVYAPVEVVSKPTPLLNPTPLKVCDDNYDGYTNFILRDKNVEILNAGFGTISYHLTYNGAISNRNGINSFNYTNDTPYKQTVFARITNGGFFTQNCTLSIVQLDIYAQDCRDQDNDGVINSDEDINGNGNFDDDDTDLDLIPNYLDDDDDGDGILTKDELIDQSTISSKSNLKSKNSVIVVIDTDDDEIENYLDDDDDGDGVLTKNEDYNKNGSPLDDDTNNNSVPDYLESSVALSTNDFNVVEFSIFPNPASHFVELKFIKNINHVVKITIYDVQGKLILNSNDKLQNNSLKLNVSSLTSGLYFLKVEDGLNQLIQKLIIQ